MDKPTKPTNLVPRAFGGVKNNFSSSLQTSGYENNVPAILGGDNLNYVLNGAGGEFDYCEKIVDFIVAMPIGKTMVVDNNNKLVYENFSTVAKTGSYNDLTNKPTNLANQDLSNLTSTGNSKLVPSQSGNANKFLITNGVSTSWKSLNAIDGEWQYSNVTLSNATTLGTYNVDLSSILPNDGQVYECILRYTLDRMDNSQNDTSYAVYSDSGSKVWAFLHVEGTDGSSTNHRRVDGQFMALVYADRKLSIVISSERNLNASTLQLLLYRRSGGNN